MDFGDGDSAGGSGGGADKDQGSQGGEGLKRKLRDLEASMKAVKDAFVQENAAKSAKIRRLMEDNVLLEETVIRLENPSSFQRPIGPMPRPSPFAVFPPEVWEGIIEKMDRASDLELLCLVFPQLEPLVKKKKKTLILFENVLPLVCKHLGRKDINNCRLVCGKWNRDVCALVANWNAPNLLPDTSKTPVPDYPPSYSLQAAYDFQNHREIQKFLMKMADYPGNSLFGRFLRLSVFDETELEQFWKSALELVKKYGQHVWNLEIDFYFGPANAIDFYKALQETLVHLPNLRYLTVDGIFSRQGPSKTKMATQIGSSPLPSLPYLQSIKLALNGESGIICAFSSLFSQQIRQIELLRKIFGSVGLKDEWLRGLINVEHLKVELNSTEDILRLLKFSSSKLKKLCLDSENFPGSPISVALGQVGNLLEKFNRLEYLDLLFCPVDSNSSLSSEMRFPRLKTLKMSVGVDEDDLQRTLDFLLWFPSLQHLMIFKNYTHETNLNVDEMDKHSTLKIRNYLYAGKMLDSNIWTLIASLEVLEIMGEGKFTRDMFENRVG